MPEERTNGGRIGFVDLGRIVAALLVLYTTVEETFLRGDGGRFASVAHGINRFLGEPLLVSPGGIGSVAVAFFFLLSGFVVTPAALRLGAGRFAGNRALRILPPLFAAVLLGVLVVALGGRPLATGAVDPVEPLPVLTNLTLANFVVEPTVAYVAVAWTLLTALLFYALVLAVLPLLRRIPWLGIAVELEVVQLLLSSSDQFGPSWHAFVASAAFLVLPIAGQISWAGWHGKLRPWATWLLLAVSWLQFVWANSLYIDPDRQPFPLAAALAMVVFCACLFAGSRIPATSWAAALAERTYSLYLMQGVVLFPVVRLLRGHVTLWLALLAGLAALVLGVELCHRLVERPSRRLARRLYRRQLPAPVHERAPEFGAPADERVSRKQPTQYEPSTRSR